MKTKFLTVVWGHAYIERFASLALPSYLAPGNLPALAAATELEVIIMTAGKDIPDFESHETFRRLREICAVRFIEIDDLIANTVYGLTLTLAYARAVFSSGADMVNTHFVFMNADFVLADGSLQNLSEHILENRSIIIAPSFRVTAETMEPLLHSSVDNSTGVLAMQPREMMAHAFKYMHPTTLAKVVNQNLCHTTRPNQFFWWIDQHTMLGRYFLIFMLCLKPERVVSSINTYCDYGFIPEMCPSGDICIMDDSDRFLMLELQLHEQEHTLLRIGQQTIKDAANDLGKWTTAEHRRAANFNVVFHSGELPAGLEKVKQDADIFIAQIQKELPAPLPHAYHQHWVQGLQTWAYSRKAQGLAASPPEIFVSSEKDSEQPAKMSLAGFMQTTAIWLNTLLSNCQRKLIGSKPFITALHPDWLDFRLLRNTIESISPDKEDRLLVVCENTDMVGGLLQANLNVEFVRPNSILNGAFRKNTTDKNLYKNIFVYVLSKDSDQLRKLIEECRLLLKTGGECQIFVHHLFDGSNFSFTMLKYHIDEYVYAALYGSKYYFIGGISKYLSQILFRLLKECYLHFNKIALIWILPAITLVLTFSLAVNLFLRNRLPGNHLMQYCSCMLIRIHKHN